MDTRNPLSIRLTEPVVFLRSYDPSGRHPPDPEDPPALIRALLTLNVTRPTRISTIEAELRGVVSLTWPEGAGVRRIEVTDEDTIYSARVTCFRADDFSSISTRRTASIGPGLIRTALNDLDHDHRDALCPPTYSQTESANPQGAIYCQPDIIAPRHASCDLPRIPYPSPLSRSHDADERGAVPCYTPLLHSSVDTRLPHSVASSSSLIGNTCTNIPLSRHPSSDDAYSGVEISSPYSRMSRSPNRGRSHTTDISINQEMLTSRNASLTHLLPTRSRFSLATLLDVVKEVSGTNTSSGSQEGNRGATDTVERGRTKSRTGVALQQGDGKPNTTFLSPPDLHASPPSSVAQKEQSHRFFGLGRVFGLDRNGDSDGHKEQGDGWKEFKKGTYTYPIVLPLPTNLPPTYKLPCASLSYTLHGVAHRPGTFTPKLTCSTTITVVSAPAISASEGGGGIGGDPGPVSMERVWEGKLGYAIDLSGRLLVTGASKITRDDPTGRSPRETTTSDVTNQTGNGHTTALHPNTEGGSQPRTEEGTITLSINIVPFEKIKIWHVSAGVEERITYLSSRGKWDDTVRRITLWNVDDHHVQDDAESTGKSHGKNKHKAQESGTIPLLPTSLSPDRSPLLSFLPSGTDPAELAGPGPYTLSTNLAIPSCRDDKNARLLNFTIRHRNAGVRIDHTLHMSFRIECLDEAQDSTTGDHGGSEDTKKKLFDIVIHVPLVVLSCRCASEWQTLPRYCEVLNANAARAHSTCPCELRTGVPRSLERTPSVDSGTSSNERRSVIGSESGMRSASRSSYPHLHSSSSRSRLSLAPLSFHEAHETQVQNGFLGVDTGTSNSARTSSQIAHGSRSVHPHGPAHSHGHSPHHAHAHASTGQNDVSATVARYAQLQTHSPTHSPNPSRPPSPLAQYERLVSGQESEVGEAPPSYESVAGPRIVL